MHIAIPWSRPKLLCNPLIGVLQAKILVCLLVIYRTQMGGLFFVLVNLSKIVSFTEKFYRFSSAPLITYLTTWPLLPTLSPLRPPPLTPPIPPAQTAAPCSPQLHAAQTTSQVIEKWLHLLPSSTAHPQVRPHDPSCQHACAALWRTPPHPSKSSRCACTRGT